jgi:hypothetical protein
MDLRRGATSETYQHLQLIENWIGNVRTSATTLGAVDSLVSRMVELIYRPPQASGTAPSSASPEDLDFDMDDDDVDFVRAAPPDEGPADIDDLPETPPCTTPSSAFTPSQSSSAPGTTLVDGMLVPEGVRFVNGTWVSANVDDTVMDLDDIMDFDAAGSERSRSCSRPDSPSMADDMEDYDDVGDVLVPAAPAPRRGTKPHPSLNTLTKDEMARFLTQQELLGDADHDAAGGRVVTTRLGLIKGSKKDVNALGAALSARVPGEAYPEDLDDLEGLDDEDEEPRASQSQGEEVAEAADAVPDMPLGGPRKPQPREQYPSDLDHVPDTASDLSDFAGSHAPSTTSQEQSSVLSSGGRRSRRASVNVDVSSARWSGRFSRSATHTPLSSSSLSVPGTPDVHRDQEVSVDDIDGFSDFDDDTDAQDVVFDMDAFNKHRNDGANRELREFDMQPPLLAALAHAGKQHQALFDPTGMFATEQEARADQKRSITTGGAADELSYVLQSQFPHLAHYDFVRASLEKRQSSGG